MAERKLKPYFKDGKLPTTAWRKEREQLEQGYKDTQTELLPMPTAKALGDSLQHLRGTA